MNELNSKLFLVTVRKGTCAYVIAQNPSDAYTAYRCYLTAKDIFLEKDRELLR